MVKLNSLREVSAKAVKRMLLLWNLVILVFWNLVFRYFEIGWFRYFGTWYSTIFKWIFFGILELDILKHGCFKAEILKPGFLWYFEIWFSIIWKLGYAGILEPNLLYAFGFFVCFWVFRIFVGCCFGFFFCIFVTPGVWYFVTCDWQGSATS